MMKTNIHRAFCVVQGCNQIIFENVRQLRGNISGVLRKGAVVALSIFFSGTSQAHQIWLEKQNDAFIISARPVNGESLLAEECFYPIVERKVEEKALRNYYMPAARMLGDFSAQSPKLDLDIVPTGVIDHGQVELRAYFLGKPLVKGKIEVSIPAGWKREVYTDEKGICRIGMPWSGIYIIRLYQVDSVAGKRSDGALYDQKSYVTSITLIQESGLPPVEGLPLRASGRH